MINTTGLLMDAWYDMIEGITVDVYKEDAPENADGNYVLIRAEGGTGDNNKRSFNDETVVIIDIVTRFENNVDRSVVEGIDSEIVALILPTMQAGFTGAGLQILNVKRESFTYLYEIDQSKKYYRKVSRYTQRVHQTA